MGLLDSVLGSVLGGGSGASPGGGGQGDLLRSIVAMLGNDAPGGGLGGLVAKFQQGGLGDVLQSWIGSGQNLPISADQLRNVLGNEQVSAIAEKLGIPHGELADKLSQMLPQVVDHLTPNGQMPQGGLGSIGDILGRLTTR